MLRAPCWAGRDCQIHVMVWQLPFPNPISFFFLSQVLILVRLFYPPKSVSTSVFWRAPDDTDGMLLAPRNLSSVKGVDILKLDLSQYQQNNIITLDAQDHGVLPLWHMNQISIMSCYSFQHYVLLLYNMT